MTIMGKATVLTRGRLSVCVGLRRWLHRGLREQAATEEVHRENQMIGVAGTEDG